MIYMFIKLSYITNRFNSVLANLMLLTPSQYTRFSRNHFTDQTLDEWYKSTLDTFTINIEEEAFKISRSLEEIVVVCI